MIIRRYTIVLDFMGGTYLRQILAPSIEDCQALVNEAIDWDAIEPAPAERRIIFADIPPTPINGLTNVWCLSGLIGEEGATIHAIATAE